MLNWTFVNCTPVLAICKAMFAAPELTVSNAAVDPLVCIAPVTLSGPVLAGVNGKPPIVAAAADAVAG